MAIDWSTLGAIAEAIGYGISIISITGFGWLIADLVYDRLRNGWRGKKEETKA